MSTKGAESKSPLLARVGEEEGAKKRTRPDPSTLIFRYKGFQKFVQGSASLIFSKIFRKMSLKISLSSKPFRVPIP